jgi:hypothetical protein
MVCVCCCKHYPTRSRMNVNKTMHEFLEAKSTPMSWREQLVGGTWQSPRPLFVAIDDKEFVSCLLAAVHPRPLEPTERSDCE